MLQSTVRQARVLLAGQSRSATLTVARSSRSPELKIFDHRKAAFGCDLGLAQELLSLASKVTWHLVVIHQGHIRFGRYFLLHLSLNVPNQYFPGKNLVGQVV